MYVQSCMCVKGSPVWEVGRACVPVCVCVTETVHVKFSEGCVFMSGYLGGKWEGRCNDTWGSIGS